MPAYLACYDYGQGGIWLYVDAASASDIRTNYPALTVFEVPPEFWNEQHEEIARSHDPAQSPIWAELLAKLKRP